MATASDTPSEINAESGEVLVEGPGGVIYSMTPEAAADTSDKLACGAALAAGQRIEAKRTYEEHRRRES